MIHQHKIYGNTSMMLSISCEMQSWRAEKYEKLNNGWSMTVLFNEGTCALQHWHFSFSHLSYCLHNEVWREDIQGELPTGSICQILYFSEWGICRTITTVRKVGGSTIPVVVGGTTVCRFQDCKSNYNTSKYTRHWTYKVWMFTSAKEDANRVEEVD